MFPSHFQLTSFEKIFKTISKNCVWYFSILNLRLKLYKTYVGYNLLIILPSIIVFSKYYYIGNQYYEHIRYLVNNNTLLKYKASSRFLFPYAAFWVAFIQKKSQILYILIMLWSKWED